MVRPFSPADVDRAATFGERAREQDALTEPFAAKLRAVATGSRARLDLWRLAEDESGLVQGIAFAAEREPAVLDVYAAVAPRSRRRGLGRALCDPMLGDGATLRARVREESAVGRAFLVALGFAERAAELSLSWSGRVPGAPQPRIRAARPEDRLALETLSRDAWAGEPGAFATRPEEVARRLADPDGLVLLAESGPGPIGYLSAARLGGMVAIEEVAVLPGFRRAGAGTALVSAALRGATHAVLSVAESNDAGRALYARLGFRQQARRLVYERR